MLIFHLHFGGIILRVLFINREIGILRAGAETYTLNIARELKSLGVEIKFVVSKPLLNNVRYPVEDFEAEYVSSPNLRNLASRMLAGNSLLEKVPIASVRCFSQKGYKFIGGRIYRLYDRITQRDIFKYLKRRKRDYNIIQLLSCPILGSRIVDELRIPVVTRFPGPPSVKDKREILKCSAVVANGDAFLRIRDTITPDVIEITPGIDSEKFKPVNSRIREKHNISSNDKVVLYVGRFDPVKNLSFLVTAVAEIINCDGSIKLMMVGEGPLYGQVVRLVNKLGIKDRVIFTGRIPNADLPQYYCAANVFVITSHYDNFPNTVLEAMACELPVIGTRVGGIPQQIKDGVNGFLIENNNLGEFKDTVLKLVNNKSLCKEIGERNREVVKGKYNWPISARKFLEVYEQILKR
mgnify:CR=1 FL=1